MAKKKMATSAETLCRYKPDAFKTFTEAVMNLKFEVGCKGWWRCLAERGVVLLGLLGCGSSRPWHRLVWWSFSVCGHNDGRHFLPSLVQCWGVVPTTKLTPGHLQPAGGADVCGLHRAV